MQDGDPSQNSELAKAVMQQVDAELFPIPPRSPDINPIENFFHLVRQKLKKDAIAKDINYEIKSQFLDRIIQTMYEIPKDHINRTISSLSRRMTLIIENDGERLKY